MTTAIKLSDLTGEQIVALRKQMRAEAKANGQTLEARNTLLDRMLQERDGVEFQHTTSDILVALQTAKLAPATLDKADRAEWIKKIQTRKQLMEKKDGNAGKFGYKASSHSFGALTGDKIVVWLSNKDNVKLLSREDVAAIKRVLA